MIVFLIAVLVVVVGLVVAAVLGKIGSDSMTAPTRTSPFELPDRPLGEAGSDSVRFDQSLRGYNMAQVDEVIDRLFDEIAALRGAPGASGRDGAESAAGTDYTHSPDNIDTFEIDRPRSGSHDAADDGR